MQADMSESKHTPGPWRWEINMASRSLHLVGGVPKFDLTVMDFKRWGMDGATVRLRDLSEDGMNIMHKVHERPDWIAPFEGRAHHADWCADITHPDMALIARAPDLAAEVERLRERVAAADAVGVRQENILIKLEERLAAERRKVEALEAAADDDEATRTMMADILKRTAVALRGPEPDGGRYGWADLPERAAAAIAAVDVMQRAAAENGRKVEALREALRFYAVSHASASDKAKCSRWVHHVVDVLLRQVLAVNAVFGPVYIDLGRSTRLVCTVETLPEPGAGA